MHRGSQTKYYFWWYLMKTIISSQTVCPLKSHTPFPKDGSLWVAPYNLSLIITYIIYINIYSSEPVFIWRLCQAQVHVRGRAQKTCWHKVVHKCDFDLCYFSLYGFYSKYIHVTVDLLFLALKCPELLERIILMGSGFKSRFLTRKTDVWLIKTHFHTKKQKKLVSGLYAVKSKRKHDINNNKVMALTGANVEIRALFSLQAL